MKKMMMVTMVALGAAMQVHLALAGPLDPNCTAEKAAKSTAAKATVGVGGRCSPAEAAKDTAKDAAGVENKGPIEKARDDDKGVLKKEDDKGPLKKN
jgi:hypothetical protein